MEFLRNALRNTTEYQTVAGAVGLNRVPVMATGLSRVHKANMIDTLPVDTNRRALVVVADEGEAQRLQEDLLAMGRKSMVFPSRDLCFRAIEGVSREFERSRIGVLSALNDNRIDTVIASVESAITYTIPKDIMQQLTLCLKPADALSVENLIETLVHSGYTRCKMVEGEGQFAVRGGIVDVFVPGTLHPARIEFWGDEIDSISLFDTVSQRRIDSVEGIIVPPAREVLYENGVQFAEQLKSFATSLSQKHLVAKENIFSDADKLLSGAMLSNIDKYMPLCYKSPETLFDYIDNSLVFLVEPSKISERLRSFSWQQNEDMKSLFEDGILCRGLDKFTLSSDEFIAKLDNSVTVLMETFLTGSTAFSVKELVSFDLRTLASWGGLVADLTEDLSACLSKKQACVILAGSERAAITLADNLRDQSLPATYYPNEPLVKAGQISVTTGGISSGIEYPEAGVSVFTQKSTSTNKKRKRYTQKGSAIGSLDELKKGDHVVHSVYGIGIFDGINKIETNGIIKDYIKIKFLKDDILYVPVTQLDLVSRYVGAGENSNIKLNRLGGDQWIKTKARVKGAVKDMAKELIALYAKRMAAPGHAFSEDCDLQHDFEYRFPYEETEDQLRCVDEIKSDMQRAVPMDRLLCGDVGFGKTEVALRAAFKCIADGKQCAVLVPTTILAWQHYKTMLQRMEGFPINVEMISRFRTAAQQTKIKQNLKRGQVDIIVGTHRLISSDVQFKDLGLLIVDEEQRFGVAQKEKIKQLFPNIDVLTLSATPIPRTLNMAMSGLRDMSIIEEAPQDRHPVQTYVLEHDRGVLLDAIRKELHRGGQVYYIYNKVQSIERVASMLKQDLPDAEIAIAHGQMSEEELSSVWRRLMDGEIDVLVCTTIIETGVDVSNVNTMIIEDADKFGLSQLHQLRGRVGRSSRRAYAYMTFRRGKALSDIATKRLEAIREYTEFGSGFKIAMRDLEIRGAGNILGAKQHGQMESVGYDMYLKLLSDAVKEEKGEKPEKANECVVDLQVGAHIPESYIESLPARLQMYRRIAEIRTDADSDDVVDELIDRFGEPPKAVLGLIDIALLRNRAAAAGISEISDKSGSMLLYITSLELEKTSHLASQLKGRVMISAGDRPYISVRALKNQHPIDTLREVLDVYAPQG
ncbi:MAG: transcription-repair coupling factor [Clostridia bacterium]|nr:transcription-repair coupling factor [Clostridia bacterium]